MTIQVKLVPLSLGTISPELPLLKFLPLLAVQINVSVVATLYRAVNWHMRLTFCQSMHLVK